MTDFVSLSDDLMVGVTLALTLCIFLVMAPRAKSLCCKLLWEGSQGVCGVSSPRENDCMRSSTYLFVFECMLQLMYVLL